jgi:hypothetical protein
MHCLACGAANPDQSRACRTCAASLTVPANAAVALGARIDATVTRRDVAALDAVIAMEMLDHRTGETSGREERLARLRSLLAAARNPVSRHEPLAALGDSLALARRILSASGFEGESSDTGAYRVEELCLIEVDRDGRSARTELFAADRLGNALARLYERHAERLREGPARTRAAEIARSIATVLGPPEPDRVRPALALDVRYADHRALGWGAAHGIVAFVRALRTLRGAMTSVESHTIEVLAARSDGLLVRRTVAGELTGSGDRYRRRPIVLWCFGADGRVSHWEQFDADQHDPALARFDELGAPPAPARLFENAATSAIDRFDRAWAIREVLATRGDRLALVRLKASDGVEDGSPGPADSLLAVEVNERGERRALVRFDAADRGAAHAELDARYAAGEARHHPEMWDALWDVPRAFAARDWDRLTRLVAADLVAEDHRPLGWGVVRSAEGYAAAIRPLAELRSDVTLRLDHLVLRERTALFVASWTGGGATQPFEIPVVIVFRARDRRVDRVHHYNLDQVEAARAQLEALGERE